MGDYSDFMRYFGRTGRMAGDVQDLFNKLYDDSHGAKRYWLTNTPWGKIRQWEDEAQRWQDEYYAHGRDPTYSGQFSTAPYDAGVGFGMGLVSGIGRMARSLAMVYQPEVMEDLGNARKPQDVTKGYM